MSEALKKGWDVYIATLSDPDALSALQLTLLVAAIAVPLNSIFGVIAAWTITKFRFKGKNLLITLDLPFAVSPVIGGLIFVLIFGRQGWFGPWLESHDIKIILPSPELFWLHCLSRFLCGKGTDPADGRPRDEGRGSGSNAGRQGLANILEGYPAQYQVGLLYGIILCNARAMGEFGAVSVVSGHIRGETNTRLHVEILYNEYQFSASFAVASLLLLLAVVTLFAEKLVYAKNDH